jgi:hypothetical protein
MTSLIEGLAQQFGWQIGRATVIAEGTSDVSYLSRASDLYASAHGRSLFDQDFVVVAAGQGDDGGVDGVNRMLVTMRQNALADPDRNGRVRYRFGGLFDKDYAGKRAFNLATQFDPSVVRYRDIFLLQPIMPAIGDGTSDRMIEATQANLPYSDLDWEMEDLCSERFLQEFASRNPSLAPKKIVKSGRIHREFTRNAKKQLVRDFCAHATLQDAQDMIKLIKYLRGYMGVPHHHIQI